MTPLCHRAREIFAQLEGSGQEPKNAGVLFGCNVIRAAHRGRLGRFDIFIHPDGRWTHDARRAQHWATPAGVTEAAKFARPVSTW